jgi:hypothetical protein
VWVVLRDSLGWSDVPRNVRDFRKKNMWEREGVGEWVWCGFCLVLFVGLYGLIITILFLITKLLRLLEH